MIRIPALLFVLPGLVAAQTDPLASHPGIGNYYRLRPDVAAAGQPSDEAFDDIKKAGFKVVLNLRTEEEGSLEERAKVEAAGLEYINIPVGSDGLTTQNVELFSRIVESADKRPIFIHCASSNRVGAFWYIHEVLNGVDEATALEEGRKAGMTSIMEPRAKDYVSRHKPQR